MGEDAGGQPPQFLFGHESFLGQQAFLGQHAFFPGHSAFFGQHFFFGHSDFLAQHFFTHGAGAAGAGAGSRALTIPQLNATANKTRASFFMLMVLSMVWIF